ncbi:MAG: Hpt domain-containing protein [Xanthomonadales bacterium]|nr:Hpt domain-containing protein [Xanthomonadales bacterium]
MSIDGFDSLLALYRLALKDKRQKLRRYMAAIREAPSNDAAEADVTELRGMLHKMAGSAGAYGFPDVSDKSRAIERQWIAWIKSPPEARRPVQALCAELLTPTLELLVLIDKAIAAAARAAEEQEEP